MSKKRVQLSVEASGYITVEMNDVHWRELDEEIACGDVDLDAVHGVNWDELINTLRFEVIEAEVVTKKRRRK